MPRAVTVAELGQVASRYGIEPAALRAVVAVESAGRGFLDNGWCKILFERHWLWKRLLSRGIQPATLSRQRPDLCGSRWNPSAFPYGSMVGQWDRVAAVITWGQRNDPDHWESYKKACYESCSWGLGQVMGFHYQSLGFPNVYDFKHHCEKGEAEQVDVMVRFLKANHLLDNLQRRDWVGFARSYNGTGQVAEYSRRLREAYERYA
jgi:hypothetical protein